eukprot:TRINITY_DN3231_c3_g3_i3.p1 TRINITY_DN3231_c3_g3~~TRINITY_DN3231_c3_g3_i3.p1  ORF type:complete len:380 (-),score=97.98 TRINITY_DN3231_c3_g3_i3:565-1704(-)
MNSILVAAPNDDKLLGITAEKAEKALKDISLFPSHELAVSTVRPVAHTLALVNRIKKMNSDAFDLKKPLHEVINSQMIFDAGVDQLNSSRKRRNKFVGSLEKTTPKLLSKINASRERRYVESQLDKLNNLEQDFEDHFASYDATLFQLYPEEARKLVHYRTAIRRSERVMLDTMEAVKNKIETSSPNNLQNLKNLSKEHPFETELDSPGAFEINSNGIPRPIEFNDEDIFVNLDKVPKPQDIKPVERQSSFDKDFSIFTSNLRKEELPKGWGERRPVSQIAQIHKNFKVPENIAKRFKSYTPIPSSNLSRTTSNVNDNIDLDSASTIAYRYYKADLTNSQLQPKKTPHWSGGISSSYVQHHNHVPPFPVITGKAVVENN